MLWCCSPNLYNFIILFLLVFVSDSVVLAYTKDLQFSFTDPKWHEPFTENEFKETQERVEAVFNHAFDGYMAHAFPQDELKPLTATGTNSLPELGNAPKDKNYKGLALTLIDSLDSLLIFNRTEDFVYGVYWIKSHIKNFDLDIRVHIFETNIRVLGGLLAAHSLCIDPLIDPLQGQYDGFLLDLASDLGSRLLPAFDTNDDIPYAWVNLRHGVLKGETRDTCTAGVGTLLLEFGVLSYYTKDKNFYYVAHRALRALWEMRSDLDLLGNSLTKGKWVNTNSGIGAGVDSFYEYLIKGHILFGQNVHHDIFTKSYEAALKHLNYDGWYYEANMKNGKATTYHFNSLQAFWIAMQVEIGDITAADKTFTNFFSIWFKFGGLPERVLLNSGQAHQSERHYPLRPELIESAYFLYKATKNPKYLRMGLYMLETIEKRTRATYGHAMMKNVITGELEDYMPSYFLAETCKYLYLLFSPDHWLNPEKFVFTTEGHLFPINQEYRDFFKSHHTDHKNEFPPSKRTCPYENILKTAQKTVKQILDQQFLPIIEENTAQCAVVHQHFSPASNTQQTQQQQTQQQNQPAQQQSNSNRNQRKEKIWKLPDDRKVIIEVGQGAFNLKVGTDEKLFIRQLGSEFAEVVNLELGGFGYRVGYMGRTGKALEFLIQADTEPTDRNLCPLRQNIVISTSAAYFGVSAHILDGTNKFSGVVLNSRELIMAKPAMACEPSLIDVKDKIVLVERGDCTFVQKALLLQEAGALGVVIGNMAGDDVFTMGTDGTGRKVLIPVFMVTGKVLTKLVDCISSQAGFFKVSMLVSKNGKPEKGFYLAGHETEWRVRTLSDADFIVKKEKQLYKLMLADPQ